MGEGGRSDQGVGLGLPGVKGCAAFPRSLQPSAEHGLNSVSGGSWTNQSALPRLWAKTADLEASLTRSSSLPPHITHNPGATTNISPAHGPTARFILASPNPDCPGGSDIESGLTGVSSCTMAVFAMGWHKPDNVAGSSAPAIMVGLFVATGGLLFGYDTG